MGMSAEELQRRIAKVEETVAAASSEDPYTQTRAEFTTVPLGPAPRSPGLGILSESTTGKVLYENGVIADPVTGGVPLFPTGSVLPGSEPWIRDIQTKWSEEKANEWRKKLIEQGYDSLVTGGIATTGGMAADLLQGLRQYHYARYNNYGKAIKARPTSKDKTSIREQIDKVALKDEVKAWGQVPFGEDLDPKTADYFSDRIIQVAQRLAKEKGWNAESAVAGAEVRVMKEFARDPALKDLDVQIGADGTLETDTEELEGDTTLRNSIVSISQLGGI